MANKNKLKAELKAELKKELKKEIQSKGQKKSRKGLIIGLIITAVVIVGGGYLLNGYLKETLGIDLFQIFNLVKGSMELSTGAKTMTEYTEDEIVAIIGQVRYDEVIEAKDTTMQGLNDWADILEDPAVQESEAYQAVKEQVLAVCGEKYSIYMYAIYKFPGIEFKVFEWTIEVTDGEISKFEEGKTITAEDVTVIMEMDEDIANQVLTGQASTDQMINWLTASMPKMRVKPVTELLKIQKLLPVVAEYL